MVPQKYPVLPYEENPRSDSECDVDCEETDHDYEDGSGLDFDDEFRGQLCIACAVDGHSWMYPVAVGVIDSETNDNWIWFMQRLWEAIGDPAGLTFSTDCGQAVMAGVTEVFPTAEHRECMWHLVQNFKKRYTGKYLMTICGLLLILGVHIGLTKTTLQWQKQNQRLWNI
jgi:hypothetical protein